MEQRPDYIARRRIHSPSQREYEEREKRFEKNEKLLKLQMTGKIIQTNDFKKESLIILNFK